jgi:hypothetical protein
MEITGKVHLMFEQSGTFKNEFIKLGYDACCYDIQNNFGETDNVVDLVAEIEKAYEGKPSIFDNIRGGDLVFAFFPCIYFETIQQTYFCLEHFNLRNVSNTDKVKTAIDRLEKRTEYHKLLYKLLYIAYDRNIRLIIENPATMPNYLISGQNFPTPTIVDKNRMLRGDYFSKPTAYWFINCEPTCGQSFQNDKEQKIIDKCKSSKKAGLCSEERSMMSPDYARNFICDFILGKKQSYTIQTLF